MKLNKPPPQPAAAHFHHLPSLCPSSASSSLAVTTPRCIFARLTTVFDRRQAFACSIHIQHPHHSRLPTTPTTPRQHTNRRDPTTMKSTICILAGAALVAAQSLSDLPTCGVSAILNLVL